MMLRKDLFQKFIDIGANLTDSMFQGIYHGKQCHPADLSSVLSKSLETYLNKIIVTSGSLSEVTEAVKLVHANDKLFTTVGCHPTRCNEFISDPDAYYQSLGGMISQHRDKVVAVGELGLDYDSRAAHTDFVEIIKRGIEQFGKLNGVVHSYTGTLKDALELIDLGFYIGLNGCSLRTDESLEVARSLPLDRLMLETDAPWCSIKQTHPKFESRKKEKWKEGMCVKSRNEPVHIIQVFEVLASIRSEEEHFISDTIFSNTEQLFFDK